MTLKNWDKQYTTSLLLTIACLALFLMTDRDARISMSVTAACSLRCCLIYHFAHANIFHLLGNLVCLWPFKPRLSTALIGYACATLSAWLLSVIVPGYGPVCGLSALLFASFARRYALWHLPIWKVIAFNVPFIFIPRVDGLLHLTAFFTSYLLWKAVESYRNRQR